MALGFFLVVPPVSRDPLEPDDRFDAVDRSSRSDASLLLLGKRARDDAVVSVPPLFLFVVLLLLLEDCIVDEAAAAAGADAFGVADIIR
jgi:hypothetical protein